MKKLFSVPAIFLLTSLSVELFAQCPMCKMAAESNLKNGGTTGLGLNGGIIYLFLLPYLTVGIIGYLWWKNRKKDADDLSTDSGEQAKWN